MAECALAFVQATITYALDPGLFEYPRYPVETLVDLVGDCEDTAILYASLVRTLGQGALIVAVDTDRDGTADHMVTFVPVDQAYADAGVLPERLQRELLELRGKPVRLGRDGRRRRIPAPGLRSLGTSGTRPEGDLGRIAARP